MAKLCEMFSCLPSQVLREEPTMLLAVVDARAALDIREIHNKGDVTTLTPGQAEYWLELNRALDDAD